MIGNETLQSSDALALHSITKYYGNNRVLDKVSFTVRRGEIHALLGENGAGKTTLMNVVRGITKPNSGELSVNGSKVAFTSPLDSAKCGIGMVHQHFLLVPAFTVEENLLLAAQQSGLLVNHKPVLDKASDLCQKLGWSIPYKALIADLTVGVQQRIEILKALVCSADIILLDEPTAVLTPPEVDELLSVLRTLRDEGRTLVFVSHKLGEVMALCDRVTVLRKGKVVGEVNVSETSPTDLARRMVGEEADQLLAPVAKKTRPQFSGGVSIRSISAPQTGPDDLPLRDITFDIPAGQILGIAGVDGNGQEELFEVFAGIRRYSAGEMLINDQLITAFNPAKLHSLNIALIPPDRQKQGLAMSLSVRDNLLFNASQSTEYRSMGILSTRHLNELAERLRTEYDIRTDSLTLPVSALSGGNQQKIVIARALSQNPTVLIAASPTRGLDVAATAYVHDKLRHCRDQGSAILLISTELDEIYALSDQIAVLYEGKVAAIVSPTTSRETIGLLMGGNSGASLRRINHLTEAENDAAS